MDAIKDLQQKFVDSYRENHPETAGKETYEVLMEAGYPMGADLQKELGVPERVFGIPSKTDDNNQPVFDEKGVPVPQDGSYAYALKKCSYSINFSEENHPILIGSETRFAGFESGAKKGHIFILDGENFKPEIDKQGNILNIQRPEMLKLFITKKLLLKMLCNITVSLLCLGQKKIIIDGRLSGILILK